MIKEQLKKKISEIELKKFKTVEDNEKLFDLQQRFNKYCENEKDLQDEFNKDLKEEMYEEQGLANDEFRTFVKILSSAKLTIKASMMSI